MTERRRRTTLAAVLALAALTVLTGCTGGDSASDSAGTADSVAGGGGGDAAAGAPEEAVPGDPVAAELLERSIVVTADLSVRSENVSADADRAVALTTTRGGLVTGDVRNGNEDFAYADLTLRVPAGQVDAVLDELAGFGTETDRSVTSSDVSAVVADVDARVQSLQGSLDRLRGLFDRAADVPDLVALEREIAQRQGDLESMQAQQRTLSDQVALATIDLHLQAVDLSGTVVPDPDSFLDGLDAGLSAFGTGVRLLLVGLGAVLPFLVVLAAVVVPTGLWRRRRTRVAVPDGQ